MNQKEFPLSSYYLDLKKFESNGEYERAYNVAKIILQNCPNEKEAMHCEIVCLIRLSKFKEANNLIDDKNMTNSFIFEKAYCLYRLNEPQKALKILDNCSELSFKMMELKAQVLYRLESYEECYKIYRAVIKQSQDDFENERLVNLSAVVANLAASRHDSKKYNIELGERSYEHSFNSACRLIEEGLYSEAESKLKVAEKSCRNSLEDDGVSEEEILDEIAIIRTQIGYCLQKLGYEKEAQRIYNSIIKQKPQDIAVIAVASNNSMVINKDQNVFDSKKKIRSCTIDALEYKLTRRQRGAIAFNQCLFSLYNHQYDYCLQLCDKLLNNYPFMEENIIFIRAVVYAKDRKIEEAVKLLINFASSDEDVQTKAKLTAVQLLLSQNMKDQACQLLENLVILAYKPGIVSSLITLYKSTNEKEKAMDLLNKAVAWHNSHKESVDLSSFWKQAADNYLRDGNPHDAVRCLEKLLKSNSNDKQTIAKLVIAYVNFDQKKAEEYCEKLPPIEFEESDISSLENNSWQSNKQKKQKIVSPSNKFSTNDQHEKLKKKRKRKIILPKNYDPNILPDPERWLPKHERSTFKKKTRRYRDTGIGKGTQGAAGTTSDQYDITKRPQTASGGTPNTFQHSVPKLQEKTKFQHKRKKRSGR